MNLWLTRGIDWFKVRADTAHTKTLLALLSFTESSVFIIPPDPLLAAIVLVHRDKWLYYALFTTAASIAGALFGYLIGAVLFDTLGVHIVSFYQIGPEVADIRSFINESVFAFTLVLAFTPIPFKAAVLAAGLAHANPVSFLAAAIIGRTARYMVVAFAARLFGEHADVILKRFWWIATGLAVVGLAAYAWYLFSA
ncbi:MAG: VTT domain-containing protein [bacterium]|nr:VTT domain-containing protein [bacterium]